MDVPVGYKLQIYESRDFTRNSLNSKEMGFKRDSLNSTIFTSNSLNYSQNFESKWNVYKIFERYRYKCYRPQKLLFHNWSNSSVVKWFGLNVKFRFLTHYIRRTLDLSVYCQTSNLYMPWFQILLSFLLKLLSKFNGVQNESSNCYDCEKINDRWMRANTNIYTRTSQR